MFANFELKVIEITKAEAKKARVYGSDIYEAIKKIRSDYPEFEVKVREVKKTKRKAEYKGLTYSYMEKYIQRRNNEEALKFYYELIGKTESESFETASYFEVKEWFLAKFPEVKTPRQMIENNLVEQSA
ncbi:MAG: hypothetical protein E7441_02350 [Ruminococcaceae bacterium]|nr:hypothetical protein [Oscillospiraceae bacterium]